jgi:hypothetical protein
MYPALLDMHIRHTRYSPHKRGLRSNLLTHIFIRPGRILNENTVAPMCRCQRLFMCLFNDAYITFCTHVPSFKASSASLNQETLPGVIQKYLFFPQKKRQFIDLGMQQLRSFCRHLRMQPSATPSLSPRKMAQ